MNGLILLRVIGSVLAVVSHYFLAFNNGPGVLISLIGQCFFLPWSCANRVWDLVALDSFYAAVNIAALTSAA